MISSIRWIMWLWISSRSSAGNFTSKIRSWCWIWSTFWKVSFWKWGVLGCRLCFFLLFFFFLGGVVCFDRCFFFSGWSLLEMELRIVTETRFFLERISGYRQRQRHFKIWIYEITTLLEAKITGYRMIPAHSNTFLTPWPVAADYRSHPDKSVTS